MNSVPVKRWAAIAFSTAVVGSACLAPSPALAASFSAIYAFGDSFVDNGNAFADTGFPPFPYYQGRNSNGPVWVENLAPLLGLSPDDGRNYAYAGSTTGAGQGLLGQVNRFKNQFSSADPNAVYAISSGTNDYIASAAALAQGGVPAVTAQVNQTIGNLQTAIASLAAIGARNIVVSNLLDFGKIPGASSYPVDPNLLSAVSAIHNQALADSLQPLSSALGVKITLLDMFGYQQQAMATPSKYGFTHATGACFNPPPNLSVCSNPDQYMFWDGIHPTAAAHQDLAKLAAKGLTHQVPEPTTVLGSVVFGGVVGLLRKKRQQRSLAATKKIS
jgi:phospholipase/lecithinase/hemolysin